MARTTFSVPRRTYRKKILKLAKGYFGSKHRLYRTANEQVLKSLAYAYRDRRNIKRDFRKLWITRISAATKQLGLSYSRFTYGLKVAGIEINRKMLSELAIHDAKAFEQLVQTAKDAIASGKKPESKPVVEAPVRVKSKASMKIEVEEKGETVEIVVAAEKPVKKATMKKEATPVAVEAVEAKKPTAKKAASKKTVEATEPKTPVKKTATKKTETSEEPKKTPVKKSTSKKTVETSEATAEAPKKATKKATPKKAAE